MHCFNWLRYRRIAVCIITACVIGIVCFRGYTWSAQAYTFTPEESLYSEAAILYHCGTGQILYEKNADQTQSPGHLAQIMTAIVVMEQCDKLDGVSITANSDLYSSLYHYSDVDDLRYADILNGDTLTVREYLYAMLLTSSCEAAVILADYFGGTSAFVSLMNEKAQELGCTSTVFTNPTGLYDAKQVTTARDMLTITQYALTLDEFEQIASASSFTPASSNAANHGDGTDWNWTHSNTMMDETSSYYYEGAKGIKTGNLTRTGRSIIAEAQRDGETYLAILMNAPFNDEDGDLQYYHLEDAAALFDWAFNSFSYVTLLGSDEEIAEVKIENSDGNSYVLVHPEQSCILLWCDSVDVTAIQQEIHLEQNVHAPVQTGDVLGTISLKFSGEVIAEIPLVAVSDVSRSFWKYNLYALKNFPNSPWFRYGLIAAAALSFLYLLLCIYAAWAAHKKVMPEDPIHLVPRATEYQDRPKQNWRQSDTVFYHGPDRNGSESDKEEEKTYEMSGRGRR